VNLIAFVSVDQKLDNNNNDDEDDDVFVSNETEYTPVATGRRRTRSLSTFQSSDVHGQIYSGSVGVSIHRMFLSPCL